MFLQIYMFRCIINSKDLVWVRKGSYILEDSLMFDCKLVTKTTVNQVSIIWTRTVSNEDENGKRSQVQIVKGKDFCFSKVLEDSKDLKWDLLRVEIFP